jgi:hypothetical protein
MYDRTAACLGSVPATPEEVVDMSTATEGRSRMDAVALLKTVLQGHTCGSAPQSGRRLGAQVGNPKVRVEI